MRLPVTLLLCLSLVPGIARSQEANPESERMGVHEAISYAEANSPVLNVLREQIEAKRGERSASLGIDSPQLLFFREGIDRSGFAEQRWALSQRIDFPLQSYYRLRRIDAEQDALFSGLEAASRRLRADVKKAYTDLLYAQEIVHLRSREIQLSQELLEAVETRVEVGESSGLDQIKAEIQLSEAESNLAEASRQFQNARYSLFHATGLDPEDQRYEIEFPDTLAYFVVNIDQEEVLALLDGHAALRSARQRVDAARYGIRQAKTGLLPDLQIDFYPQDFGTGFRSYGFQVGFSVPLWFMFNQRGVVRQARALEQEAAWQQQQVSLDLKREVEQAWHSYETSDRTIRRYHELVQGRAEELLALTTEGYRIGEVDLLTLLDTQRTYLSSQKRYYDALHDYYFHLIDLEQFLGRDLVYAHPAAPAVTHTSNATPSP